jgi:hypothetical protein
MTVFDPDPADLKRRFDVKGRPKPDFAVKYHEMLYGEEDRAAKLTPEEADERRKRRKLERSQRYRIRQRANGK